jgi:hypothetical protein
MASLVTSVAGAGLTHWIGDPAIDDATSLLEG